MVGIRLAAVLRPSAPLHLSGFRGAESGHLAQGLVARCRWSHRGDIPVNWESCTSWKEKLGSVQARWIKRAPGETLIGPCTNERDLRNGIKSMMLETTHEQERPAHSSVIATEMTDGCEGHVTPHTPVMTATLPDRIRRRCVQTLAPKLGNSTLPSDLKDCMQIVCDKHAHHDQRVATPFLRRSFATIDDRTSRGQRS